MKVCNEVKGENKYQRDCQDVNSLTNKRITKQDIIDICLVLLNSESGHCLRLSLLLGDSRYIEKKLSECTRKNDHRRPKLAVCVLEDFIDSLNISLINEQVEMKTQIKKHVNKTFLTFYLLLLDVY